MSTHPIPIIFRPRLSAAVSLVLLLPGMALAQRIVTSPRQDSARSSAYWTPEKKAAAQPMSLRSVSGTPSSAPASLMRATGAPGMVGGTAPAGTVHDAALVRAAGLAASASVSPAVGAGSTVWYAYPPPSTLALPALDYFAIPLFPNTALGKLFFSGPGGSFVCSAQSVTSNGTWGAGNKQTVVTAGHCCSDGAGSFYGNWAFDPAYVNGATPYGSWSAAGASVFTAWHNGGDLSLDLCVLQMFKLSGQNINDRVGALGYAWNQPLPQSYVATGWPQAAPFSGGLLYYALTSDAETDTQQAGALPYTHGVGSAMTGGSSGGAWLLKYQSYLPGTYNLFNGLNSYKYTSPARPAEMFGPYIDANFVALLQAVSTAPAAP